MLWKKTRNFKLFVWLTSVNICIFPSVSEIPIFKNVHIYVIADHFQMNTVKCLYCALIEKRSPCIEEEFFNWKSCYFNIHLLIYHPRWTQSYFTLLDIQTELLYVSKPITVLTGYIGSGALEKPTSYKVPF